MNRLLVVMALVSFCFAHADPYQDWLDGKLSPSPKTGPPLLSDDEWQALPESRPFDYQMVDLHGIPTPMLNGRFLMGVEYRYAPNSFEQCDYDTRYLACAGINVIRAAMRSVPEEGGAPASVERWRDKDALFRKRGIAALLEPGGGNYTGAILQDLYENVLGKAPPDAFSKWRDALPGTTRYGDFFNADYRGAHGQVLADLMKALGPAATMGYIYSDEPELRGIGPDTAAADADWRSLLKRFYRDGSPGDDSNADGATFNSVFGKKADTWDEVAQFTREEYESDARARGLVEMWMRYGHARFIDALSAECQKVLPAASVSEAYIGGEEVSLLNAMPHNRYIGFGNYGRIADTARYAALAHAYNKPGYTFHINRGQSNYHGVRHIGVASLPFTTAQIWWHLTTGCNDGLDADYGRRFSLANWWEVNDHAPKAWGGKINRLVEYDSRFLIVPQIAPFVGRFDSMPTELANGVLWVDPPCADLVRNNHAVTEEALALGELELDIDRYRLVIFMKRAPALFARTHELLRDYVRRGGTVLVNVNDVGSGKTLFGQDNAQYWLAPYEVARKKPAVYAAAGHIIYEDRFTDPKRWERDRLSHEGPCSLISAQTPGHVGAYPDGASGSFIYRFQIPEPFTHFRISDVHYVWGRQNKTQMWISGDGENWSLGHEDTPQDVSAYTWSNVYSVARDLDGRRDLYVRYYFKAGDPTRRPQDNRGAALAHFKLEALTSNDVAELEKWRGQFPTSISRAGRTLTLDHLEPCVLPGEGMQTDGLITDGKGVQRPLVIVHPEGAGKWVAWNAPGAVPDIHHNARGFSLNDWRARWELLDGVVRAYTSGRIEDYDTPHIAQGDGCLLATTWEGVTGSEQHAISFRSANPRVVVYEVLDGISEGGPFIETAEGAGSFTRDMSRSGIAHLWVIKPYGEPILLCADGTVKHVMKIDDGEFSEGRLTFEMAQTAAVSCPSPPMSATHAGQIAKVDYDEATRIARIAGTGQLGTCTLTFR